MGIEICFRPVGLLFVFLSFQAVAAGTPVKDTALFETNGPKGLFGPTSVPEPDIYTIPLFSESKSDSQGEIVAITQDIPKDVALDIWQQAMDTCTGYKYTVSIPTPCGNVTISPTTSECKTGKIGTRTVGTRCCVNVTRKYPNCGILSWVSASKTVNVNKTLPVKVGEPPQGPVPAGIDIGAVVDFQASVDVGMELVFEKNPGTVEVSYGTDITLTPSADEVVKNAFFTLTANHKPDSLKTFMNSDYPSISFIYRYFIDANAFIDLKWAMMEDVIWKDNKVTGKQVYGDQRIFDYSTAASANADPDGRIVGEFVSVEAGVSGMDVRFMNEVPYAPEFTQDLIFQFPLVFSWDVTQPFTCPSVPIIGGACGPPVPASTDLFEISVRTPLMDTPAWDPFSVGVDGFNGDPIPVLRNEINPDGSITNTTPSGWRPLVAGLLGDFSNIDINNINTDEANLSADFARLDIDIDGLLSLAYGGVNPFGVNFTVESGVDPTTGKKQVALDLEGNAIDLDIVSWFHLDQRLNFLPNLLVVFDFDKPVEIRTNCNPGPCQFQTTSRYELAVDADAAASIDIRMPDGGVTITPTYSLANNLFTNETGWYYTPGLQTTYFQLKIDGFIPNAIAGSSGIDPNLTLHQSTLTPGPIKMGSGGSTSYSFGGFLDVPGTPITVGRKISDIDGDGIDDGDDNCVEAVNSTSRPDAGGNSQRDTDADGIGNVCDPDLNNDGRVDFADMARMKGVFFTSDPDADLNGDGRVDFADLAKIKAMFFRAPGPSGLVP